MYKVQEQKELNILVKETSWSMLTAACWLICLKEIDPLTYSQLHSYTHSSKIKL